MRSTVMLWIVSDGARVSSVSTEPLPILPPPDGEKLLAGLTQAISDSHFQPPIEVTDPIRAPVNFTSPWMVCQERAKNMRPEPSLFQLNRPIDRRAPRPVMGRLIGASAAARSVRYGAG
jgi:hypothetical protein